MEAALIFTSWAFTPQICSRRETGVEQDGGNHMHSFESALPGRSSNKFREIVVSFRDLLRLSSWLPPRGNLSLIVCYFWLIRCLPHPVHPELFIFTHWVDKRAMKHFSALSPTVTGWVVGRTSPDVISFPCGIHFGEVCIYKMLPHTFLVNTSYFCMLAHMHPFVLTFQHWSRFGRTQLSRGKSFNNSGTNNATVYCFTVNFKQDINKIMKFSLSGAAIQSQSTVLGQEIVCFYLPFPLPPPPKKSQVVPLTKLA